MQKTNGVNMENVGDFSLFSQLYLSEKKSSEFFDPATAVSLAFVGWLSVRNLWLSQHRCPVCCPAMFRLYDEVCAGFCSDTVRFSLRRWSAFVHHLSASSATVGWLMSRVSPSVYGVSSSLCAAFLSAFLSF